MSCHERPDYAALAADKERFYAALEREVRSLVADERDAGSNLANTASALYHALRAARGPGGTNWAGFYLAKPRSGGGDEPAAASELVLGPFCGLPAVTRIPFDKGVCGACARTRETVLVRDVHAFPGHIACDAASNSEIVVPLLSPAGDLLAVLDLDCPDVGGFDEADQQGLEAVAAIVAQGCDWDAALIPAKPAAPRLAV